MFNIFRTSLKQKLKRSPTAVWFVYNIKTFLTSTIVNNKFLMNMLFRFNNYLFSRQERYVSLDYKKALEITKKQKERSIALIGGSYYCYTFMAQELRKRGWKAISISISPPTKLSFSYDLEVYDPDFKIFKENYLKLLNTLRRYKVVHFYSNPIIWDNSLNHIVPLDIMLLKKAGVKIGFTPSGCLQSLTQEKFSLYTKGVCNKCVWQNDFTVCSNAKNQNLINRVHQISDYISYEPENTIGISSKPEGPKIFTEPLLYALDPQHWSLDIKIPQKFIIQRKTPKHLLILSGFGNKQLRTRNNRDIKGTGAMHRGINRLIAEGYLVQHIHINDVPLKDVRYIQAQVDIAIDQLNYGRYGAFARECMMLGKPTIGKIDFLMPNLENAALKECPIINANEETIYERLKELILLTSHERKKIGLKSRDFMLKWHSVEKCADRFEKFYDNLF